MNKELADLECRSCGRYVGLVSRCPYCDAVTAVAVMQRRMKLLSLILVVAGVGFLYLMTFSRDVQTLEIGDIRPVMNYASARVAGRVVRRPYISRTDGNISYLSLLVDDGTGLLRVLARNDVAFEIVDGDNMPGKGDSINVSGRLSVNGDGAPKLQVLVAEQISKMVEEPE